MRRNRSSHPFPHLGPLDEEIPIDTGTAVLTAERDGSILVTVNGAPSSHQHVDPRHLVFEYMRWMKLAIDLHLAEAAEGSPAAPGSGPAPRTEIAHLGGGGCSLPRALAAEHPEIRQTVVELDAALAEQVRAWFDLPRAPRLRIRAEDALVALRGWREARFDVLVRDVFAGARTPAGLLTAEAAAHSARVLRPGGILLANCAPAPGSSDLADEVVTLSTAFSRVAVIAEPANLRGRRRGNCVLLASQGQIPSGLDRALRSDAVSVRLADESALAALRRSGRVRESAPPETADAEPAQPGRLSFG